MIQKTYNVKNIVKALSVTDTLGNIKSDVVIRYLLLVTGTENEKSADISVVIDLNLDDLSGEFKAIETITKQDLITWGINAMSEDKAAKVDEILEAKLNASVSEETVAKPVIVGRRSYKLPLEAEDDSVVG